MKLYRFHRAMSKNQAHNFSVTFFLLTTDSICTCRPYCEIAATMVLISKEPDMLYKRFLVFKYVFRGFRDLA